MNDDDDIQPLLDAEREREGISQAARDRVGRRLSASLGLPVAPSTSSTDPHGPAHRPAAPPPDSALTRGALKTGLAGLLIGAGAATAVTTSRPAAMPVLGPLVRPPEVVVVAPTATSSPGPHAPGPHPSAPRFTERRPSTPSVTPPAAATSVAVSPQPAAAALSPSAKPSGRDEALRHERLLLERARSALLRGEPEAALVALETMAERYPEGRLQYEREALTRVAKRQLEPAAP